MTIYTITEHAEEGSWGGANFRPEAFSTKRRAENRYEHLKEGLSEYCGYYYLLDDMELNYKSPDY